MSKRLDTIPQLDSIRAVAVFAAILEHYLGIYNICKFEFGNYSIDIFFVLSGYLITAILLEQKDINVSRFLLIKNFTIKRVLRIFPLYYIILIFWSCASLFGIWSWDKGCGIYYYTYTSNILFYLKGLQSVQLNHTWSLAVEEQFYIFWPWLMLFIPRKKEAWIILVLMVFSVIYKLIYPDVNHYVLTLSQLDTIGMGALIAYMLKYNYTALLDFLYKFRIPIIIITGIVAGTETPFSTDGEHYLLFPRIIHFICILIFSTTIIISCHNGFKGIFGGFLNNKFVRHLGKISYGLYLYHKAIPLLLSFFTARLLHIKANNIFMLVLSIGLTVLISHLSYTYMEKKFIRLKTKFDV